MYAVWSRQDAGAQWRSKAGGRENAGTVVPRVSPTGRQGQAMEDVRIRYSTGPREGAGVVQGMAGEEQARTEQGVGERPGKPRAVLGRRVEPYREDIEGFIEICNENNSKKDEVRKYVEKIIRKKPKREGKKADDKNDYEPIPIADKYVCDKKDGGSIYLQSINVHIKKKILEKKKDAEEYRRRVLDVKYWNIDKNREWLNTGRVAEYESNDTNGAASVGIENGGQFRLVGLEKITTKIFNARSAYPDCNYKSGKIISFYTLKKDEFQENERNEYRLAFQNGNSGQLNFIAYVVKHLKGEKLLCNVKGPKKTKVAFPTVLAQEMEQLDEAGYFFATISEGEEVKKVIALPEGAARDIRTESTRTAPQPTPSETPEG